MTVTRGFSLIEVLLAGTIFIVAITAMTSTFSAASVTGSAGLHRDQARDIARQRIEELIALPTGSALLIGAHEEKRNGIGAIDADGLYTIKWTGTPHEDLPVVRLALAVEWAEPQGGQRVTLETMR